MRPSLLFCAILMSTGIMRSQNIDIEWLKQANVNRNKNLDPTAKFLSNTSPILEVALPVALFSGGLIRKDSSLKQTGLVAAESIAASALISFGLKYSVNRARPYETYPFIDNQDKEDTPSFPSAHTSLAFSTSTAISLRFPKWYVIVPAYSWACAVGYSRLHLGVHYPSDVAAGIFVGVGSSLLCYKINKMLSRSKKKKIYQ